MAKRRGLWSPDSGMGRLKIDAARWPGSVRRFFLAMVAVACAAPLALDGRARCL